MPNANLRPPAAAEVPVFYETYTRHVPPGDIIETLERQIAETANLLAPLSDADAAYRYAPGKWSIKQVVGHLSDSERIFSYRALCFSRSDPTPLPGFDENEYVAHASFDARSLTDLLAELKALRDATIRLFSSMTAEEAARRGVANGRELNAGSVAYIIAGHERHHYLLLGERYMPGIPSRAVTARAAGVP